MKQEDLDQAHEITTKMAEAIFKETGKRYIGVMYGGFIITKEGVGLIEYNARFGDPEAMNIMPLMKTNFSEVAQAAIEGRLNEINVEFEDKASVCKYLVPKGYPDSAEGEGEEVDVSMVDTSKVKLYYASVNEEDGKVLLSKSRTIGIVGIHEDISEAERLAEDACNQVKGPVRHRTDIGTRSLLDKRIEHMKELGRSF